MSESEVQIQKLLESLPEAECDDCVRFLYDWDAMHGRETPDDEIVRLQALKSYIVNPEED
jgi:hypothetical protein